MYHTVILYRQTTVVQYCTPNIEKISISDQNQVDHYSLLCSKALWWCRCRNIYRCPACAWKQIRITDTISQTKFSVMNKFRSFQIVGISKLSQQGRSSSSIPAAGYISSDEVFQRTQGVIRTISSTPESPHSDAHFVADLGLDSLQRKSLNEKLHIEFCVPRGKSHENFLSVKEVVDFFSTHPKARWSMTLTVLVSHPLARFAYGRRSYRHRSLAFPGLWFPVGEWFRSFSHVLTLQKYRLDVAAILMVLRFGNSETFDSFSKINMREFLSYFGTSRS